MTRSLSAAPQFLLLCAALLLFQGCLQGSSPANNKPESDGSPPDISTDLPIQACTVDVQCNDGLFCTGQRACVNGFCEFSQLPPCGDAIECTIDYCDEYYESCLSFPDDSLCQPGFMCDPQVGCVARAACLEDAECNDGQPCTDDLCVDGSCTYAPDNSQCGVADFCAGAQVCAPFLGCIAGSERNCDDGDTCTIDRCDATLESCVSEPKDSDNDGFVDAACDGGDDCNDTRESINPGATDVCDGIDNDCDGVVDDEDPFGASPANATAFAPAAGDLLDVQLTTTPNGRRALVYLVDDNGDPRVYLKVTEADGTPLTDPDVEVGLASMGENTFAATADGEEIVVTRITAGTATDTFDILLDRFSTDNGAKVTNTVLVLDDESGVEHIDIASSGAAEPAGVHVAWSDTRTGRLEVYVSQVQPTGIISSTPNALRYSVDDTNPSTRPRVATLADGTTVVAWVESAGVVVGQLVLPEVSLQRTTVQGSAGATTVDIHPLAEQFIAVYAEPATSGDGLRAALVAPDISTEPTELLLLDTAGTVSSLNLAGGTSFLGAGFTADITGVDRAYFINIETAPVLAGDLVEVGDTASPNISISSYLGVTFALLALPNATESLELIRSDCPITE